MKPADQCTTAKDVQDTFQTRVNKSPDVADDQAAEQQRLQELYLQQQRRLACPGCGETPFLG